MNCCVKSKRVLASSPSSLAHVVRRFRAEPAKALNLIESLSMLLKMKKIFSHERVVREREAELAALRTDLETERTGRAAEREQWVSPLLVSFRAKAATVSCVVLYARTVGNCALRLFVGAALFAIQGWHI